MTVSTELKPGEKAPLTGQYGLFEPDGRFVGVSRMVSQGAPLPPAPLPEMAYRRIDHDAGLLLEEF